MIYLYDPNAKVHSWSRIAALVHLAAAIGFFAYQQASPVPGVITPTTKTVGLWVPADAPEPADIPGLACPRASGAAARNRTFVVRQVVLGGMADLDARALIVAFHMLSFLFQIGASLEPLTDDTVKDRRIVHLIEYSMSAPLMVVAICAQLGVTDVFLLTSVAVNCWACMIFGLGAELLHRHTNIVAHWDIPFTAKRLRIPAYVAAHLAGWVALAAVIIAAASNLVTYSACAPASASVPGWILGLAAVEFTLFSLFGVVQAYSFLQPDILDDTNTNMFTRKPRHTAAYEIEAMYITLSLVSKLTLGLFIFIGNSI